jgi:nitrogen fixation-related uncharacterized protein
LAESNEMSELGEPGVGDDSRVEFQSQIEIMRKLVEEAEKWSDLLLKYSRSMLFHFIPATVLAVGVAIAQLFWTVSSWGYYGDHMHFVNTAAILVLAIVAALAVRKEAEAVVRYGANKGRHREWSKRFEALRKTERQLGEMLSAGQKPDNGA